MKDNDLNRRQILDARIKEFEKQGIFDGVVEDNPPARTLMPSEIDYLGEKLSTRLGSFFANRAAIRYYEKEIKRGNMTIEKINGIENYFSVKGGAVLTCNHFSVYDNYAVYRAIRKYLPRGHNLYKVIREGNYTAFGGIYGYFFRHCNTLPLSGNRETMKKFMKAVDALLLRGEKILIYPEQEMWRNYKKPRPLKDGAFRLAAKSGVPVVPVFISMRDGEKVDSDGYPVQIYTLWFSKPVYPEKSLSVRENAEIMKEKNYEVWKEIYERVYGVPLLYGGEE